MLEKRVCRCCGKEFFAKKDKQWYCSKKCFKKDYFIRRSTMDYGYPTFKCPDCGNTIHLRFDPIKETFFWTEFDCPYCGSNKIKIEIFVTSKKIYILL